MACARTLDWVCVGGAKKKGKVEATDRAKPTAGSARRKADAQLLGGSEPRLQEPALLPIPRPRPRKERAALDAVGEHVLLRHEGQRRKPFRACGAEHRSCRACFLGRLDRFEASQENMSDNE